MITNTSILARLNAITVVNEVQSSFGEEKQGVTM